MPAPIDKIGAKAIAPQADVKTPSAKFSLPKREPAEAAAATKASELPPMKEVTAAEKKTIESDLRKRIERTGSEDPTRLFSADMKDLKTRVNATANRIESMPKQEGTSGLRDRLNAIEAQFNGAEEKLKNVPDTNNLRDLLSMQTEMYAMSQNIELLSKAVDGLTSGVKQTLQTQV
jgi:vacuolar-type H+-ATPase subunit E/Vma4